MRHGRKARRVDSWDESIKSLAANKRRTLIQIATGSGKTYTAEIEETAYWLELLVDADIVSPRKLQPLRDECDELTAIFVTVLKRSKEQ